MAGFGVSSFMKRTAAFFLVFVLLFQPVSARQDQVVCGTHSEMWQEEVFLHRQSMRALEVQGKLRPLTQSESQPKVVGNIAIFDESGGVVARRNVFNLNGKTLTFLPGGTNASAYRFQLTENTYDAAAATTGTLLSGLGDDDSREMNLPFAFPFYGKTHQRIFVNSDGNLTFEASDPSTAVRSLGRLAAGPPRIAPLFRDLDPTRSLRGVTVLAEPGRFVVSWVDVPEYSFFGTGVPQTFQVRLYPDGRIQFAYQAVVSFELVVGISPGNLQGVTNVVSFSEGSDQEFSATVAESFGGNEEVDMVRAAQRFYEHFDDSYDYLVVINNMKIRPPGNAVANQVTVRNHRSGYGDVQIDVGREYGSRRRLQAVINMGHLEQYPEDPRAPLPLRSITGDTTLSLIAHEVGHLFLAFASVRDSQNPRARPMLGVQMAHWSFNFNSDGSVMEGNRIRDNGEHATPRFTTETPVQRYSELDQYLMGFRSKEEVSPMFLVTGSPFTNSRPPEAGVNFNGQRRNITIDEIIAAEGRRTPDHTLAQRHFRIAFMLVTERGKEPTAKEIQQLDTYRREFEAYFHERTSHRAWVDTTLRKSLHLSLYPGSGVVEGGSAEATVSLDRPLPTPLTVQLVTQTSAAWVPQSVGIPAGALSATFRVHGIRPGPDVVSAWAGEEFERSRAPVQVVSSPAVLRLQVVSGDRQTATPGQPLPSPVVIRATDVNDLPYPGLLVRATVSAGGQLEPSEAATDHEGRVSFRWTPGAMGGNEFTARLADAESVAVSAIALGRPAIFAGGVVNAASFQRPLSPGSLASIFGANLAAGVVGRGILPTSNFQGVQVLMNNTPVPLLFVTDQQINLWVPSNLPLGTADVAVTTPLGPSLVERVEVAAAAPGLFFDAASGYGAVLTAGTGQPTFLLPVERGGFVEIYCTGLGRVRASGQPGIEETVSTPQVFLNGAPIQVVFSGLSPQFVGLYQVNARIPENAPSGDATLTLAIDGAQSNAVKIKVR